MSCWAATLIWLCNIKSFFNKAQQMHFPLRKHILFNHNFRLCIFFTYIVGILCAVLSNFFMAVVGLYDSLYIHCIYVLLLCLVVVFYTARLNELLSCNFDLVMQYKTHQCRYFFNKAQQMQYLAHFPPQKTYNFRLCIFFTYYCWHFMCCFEYFSWLYDSLYIHCTV